MSPQAGTVTAMKEQLLVAKDEHGFPTLEPVAAASDWPPYKWYDHYPDMDLPDLGSEPLLLIARHLKTSGFRIRNIHLRNRQFEPLNEVDDGDATKRVEDVIAGVAEDAPGIGSHFVLVGFTAYLPGAPVSFSLNRNGEVTERFQNDEEHESFLKVLNAAYRTTSGAT